MTRTVNTLSCGPLRLRCALLLALGVIIVSAQTASCARQIDTTDTGLRVHEDRNALDYILAVPSFALKLPFHVLSAIVSAPVKLVENQDFLEHLEGIFSFKTPYGLRPLAGSSSRTGLRGGLKYSSKNAFTTGIPIRIKGSYSTNNYEYIALRLGGDRLFDSRLGAQAEIGYRRDTRERLYGLGPASSIDDEANYERRGGFGSLRGYWDIVGGVTVQGFVDYRHVSPGDGGDNTTINDRDSMRAHFSDADLFGLNAKLDLYEFGGVIGHDWRDIKGSPRRGGTEMFSVSYVTGDPPGEAKVGFWRLFGEVTQYLEIYNGRVIGLRVAAQHTEQDDGTRIPFYELAQLGGSNSLRAFKSGRFIDKDLALMSIEYRWPVLRVIDVFLFTDHGRVFDDLQDNFTFEDFETTYGGGVRVWNQDGHLEATLAKGREQFRLYLSVGESF